MYGTLEGEGHWFGPYGLERYDQREIHHHHFSLNREHSQAENHHNSIFAEIFMCSYSTNVMSLEQRALQSFQVYGDWGGDSDKSFF